MINRLGIVVCFFVMIVSLIGCSDKGDATKDIVEGAEVVESSDKAKVKSTQKSLKLPTGFPSDFPLPENIKLTKVEENSEGDTLDFDIRFEFNPSLDLNATFEMYNNYAQELDYTIIIGGDQYFAEGVFQFGATSKLSASNMFIVTLKPEGTTFGSVVLKISK